MEKNVHGHFRGLHIVLINPKNGKVELAKIFDTYKSSDLFDNFIKNEEIPEGYIIVAACQDDFMTNLSTNGKIWFQKLGSKEIDNVEYRCAFGFIAISGKTEKVQEKMAISKNAKVFLT